MFHLPLCPLRPLRLLYPLRPLSKNKSQKHNFSTKKKINNISLIKIHQQIKIILKKIKEISMVSGIFFKFRGD